LATGYNVLLTHSNCVQEIVRLHNRKRLTAGQVRAISNFTPSQFRNKRTNPKLFRSSFWFTFRVEHAVLYHSATQRIWDEL